MNFSRVARFVTRPCPDKDRPVDLALMIVHGGTTALKPHTIYEIREIMGELVISELGSPAKDSHVWGRSISDIINSEVSLFLTKEEIKSVT